MDPESVRRFVKEQIAYLKDHEVEASGIDDSRRLASDPNDPDAPSLELDSLDQVELALAIETEFNVGTPEDIDFQAFGTVNDVVEFVVSMLENASSGKK